MSGSDFNFMVQFAIEQAEQLPVRQRVRVLRGAALASSNSSITAELSGLAADLEEADKRCHEFAFRLAPDPTSASDGRPS